MQAQPIIEKLDGTAATNPQIIADTSSIVTPYLLNKPIVFPALKSLLYTDTLELFSYLSGCSVSWTGGSSADLDTAYTVKPTQLGVFTFVYNLDLS